MTGVVQLQKETLNILLKLINEHISRLDPVGQILLTSKNIFRDFVMSKRHRLTSYIAFHR